jgi:hypothetical protein
MEIGKIKFVDLNNEEVMAMYVPSYSLDEYIIKKILKRGRPKKRILKKMVKREKDLIFKKVIVELQKLIDNKDPLE